MNDTDRALIEANHKAQAEQIRRAFVPGVFENMPAAEYHSCEAMSSSGAKKINRSPAHYLLMRQQVSTPTDAMIFGTACHEGVLEPLTFNERVIVKPKYDMRKTTDKAAAVEFAEAHAGKILLTQADMDRCRWAIDAVYLHPAAVSLLDGSRREVSAFWIDQQYGCPAKARFDALNHGGIIDLKTCQDASPEAFARQAASLQYHVQAAAYNSGHEHTLNASMEFFAFIVVESEPPHAVAAYELPGNAVQAGARLWNEALTRYAHALKHGIWAGYPDFIQRLDFPRWALTFNH